MLDTTIQAHNNAATIPTAKAIKPPPKAEATLMGAAPVVPLAEAGFAVLALVLASVALVETAPVFVAAVLLVFPAAGFAVASAFVAEAEAPFLIAPAVIVTGRNSTIDPPSVVVKAVGMLSMESVKSVIVEMRSLASGWDAVQVALVVPSRTQSSV